MSAMIAEDCAEPVAFGSAVVMPWVPRLQSVLQCFQVSCNSLNIAAGQGSRVEFWHRWRGVFDPRNDLRVSFSLRFVLNRRTRPRHALSARSVAGDAKLSEEYLA